MTRILIVYATDHGGTERMAQAVAKGAESVEGVSALLKTAEQAVKEDVLAADAMILGTPVHMGSMDWRLKKFIDQATSALWTDKRVNGRVGAVFATGSGYGNAGAGAELAMLSLLNDLVELGYIIVPLPNSTPGYPKGGLHWGAYARAQHEDLSPLEGGLTPELLEAAGHHGANVARVAKTLKGLKLLNP